MRARSRAFPHLFSPGRIGNLTLRNRAIMGVYPTHYATESMVSARMVAFYRARARGGAALIVAEGASIDYPHDYRDDTQLRIDSAPFRSSLRRIPAAVHPAGCKAFLHLNYPARTGPAGARVSVFETATAERLKSLASRFGEAAAIARDAGFDGVEVQAGWGELASRLLSPAYNRRPDEYGGTLPNRARFLLQVIEKIRSEAGLDLPVQVKLGAEDYMSDGFSLEEAEAVAVMLEKAGVASILVSAGTADTRRWAVPPQAMPEAPLVPLAARIKQAVGIPVIAVGKIKGPEAAETILEAGNADFVALTRPFITDPDWCKKAREGRAEDIRGCIYCLQDCSGQGVPGLGRACTVNPYTGREAALRIKPAVRAKRVVVIGGGPAGMQAALTAAERGHAVHILEQWPRLGGVFAYPRIAGYKGDVTELPRYLAHRVTQLGIEVSLNVRASAGDVLALHPDSVIVAAGAERFIPPYPGIEGENVVEARDLWSSGRQPGRKVVVIGAGSGAFEAAEWLRDRGSDVTILTRRAEYLSDMTELPRTELLARLAAKGVAILTRTAVQRIEPHQVVFRDETGAQRKLPADTVVVATGALPNTSLTDQLRGRVEEIYTAGDCVQPGTGGMAIRSGLDAGMRV